MKIVTGPPISLAGSLSGVTEDINSGRVGPAIGEGWGGVGVGGVEGDRGGGEGCQWALS